METHGRRLTKKGEPMSNFVPRLSKESAAVQGELFLMLRNTTRLRIIDLLAHYGGLLCVAEIAAVLEEHASVISSHLTLLRAAKLVLSRRVHRENRYRLNAAPLLVVTHWLEGFRRFIDPSGHQWAVRSKKS